ncbi:MAG TPA: argininosuccinate lyase [Sphingobacteriaceae bacterium]|nr:argininosuccinate lyase [Sphingobacteriaceae bacterium]
MKLWQKDKETAKSVETFTVGKDREMDLYMAAFDVLGSLAHTQMLESIGLLTKADLMLIHKELKSIYKDIAAGKFIIEEGTEDVHSQVELLLTQRIGDAGKKIHSGRSRNDQVLVDLKLFFRDQIKVLCANTQVLFDQLITLSEAHKDKLLPGYTHLQIAMPSSFGLWFGAYAESLADDMITLYGAWEITNKNPLGSAAGFGSSFPINRKLTTQLLGFEDLNYNVVYAQMSRGKTERILSQSLANFAATLSRMSMDACIYLNQNFAFISFPDELTTGSSIMPHKKNPDVFELIRAHCNRILALPNEIYLISANLPSGYHRDFQLLKEHLFPALKNLKDCLKMATLMIENIDVKKDILNDEKYKYLFTVEEMNKLVLQGMPLRDAYKKIGAGVENNTFVSDMKLAHSHEGSIGNLQNEQIKIMMNKVIARFDFKKVNDALQKLLQ